MTELLLSAGADPNVGVKPDGLHKYVVGCAGRAYVDMMMMMLERLKKEAYPPSGKVRDVARSNLSQVRTLDVALSPLSPRTRVRKGKSHMRALVATLSSLSASQAFFHFLLHETTRC
jgi:hypothetical protein